MDILKSIADLFLHLDKHLSELIQNFGVLTYLILFLVVFAETGFVITPFLPGDSLLFSAGTFAALGALNPILLFLILFLAAVIGDTVNYWIGNFIGPKAFQKAGSRFFKKEYLTKTEHFYEKHGGKAIILARFIPVIRTFAPFVAGVGKMSYWKFITYNIVGGFLWVGLFVGAGYFFGNIPQVKHNFTLVIFAIIGISIVPIFLEVLKNSKYYPLQKRFYTRFNLVILAILFVILVSFTFLIARQGFLNRETSQQVIAEPTRHFQSATPYQNAVIAAAPKSVVLDFNLDLTQESRFSIIHVEKEYARDGLIIDDNKRTMRRTFDTNAPEGTYSVSYKACFIDKTCEEGSFQFNIDPTKLSEYEDLKNQKAVTIDLTGAEFKPKNIIIRKGTTVVWKNSDDTEHYINTDSHPSHTYYPQQNSQALKKGDTFLLTFTEPGLYPYHCSSHYPTMTGNILVQ